MAKIPLLTKNNLPAFMEEFIGAAAKTIDKIDTFDNDGWLSTVPFGKLAGFFVKKIIEKDNLEKALVHAIGFSIGTAFSQALLRNGLNPSVENEENRIFRNDLKSFIGNEINHLSSFEIDNFKETNVVIGFVELFSQLLKKSELKESAQIRVKEFMKDYGKINFIRLLEQQKTVYGKLIEHLNSESFKFSVQQNRREQYYARLKNMYTEITLNDKNGMTLDAVYIEPHFKVFERSLKKKELKKDNKAFVDRTQLEFKGTLHGFILDWLKGNSLPSELKANQPKFILTYGYPGQGKTSFCKRLLNDLLTDHPIEKNIVFVRFRNLDKPQNLKSELLNTIVEHLKEYHDIDFNKQELRNCFLLLDGLDELVMKNRLQSTDVEEICRAILFETSRFPNLSVLITSRYGYVDIENIPSDEVVILQMEELSLEEQKEWLKKYQVFHPLTWLTEKRLEKIWNSSKYLAELITQPILLHMVASLKKQVDLDANRAKVYESLFDQITNPSWKGQQISVLKGLNATDLRNYLRELAFEIFKSGDGYIHKSQVEQLRATEKFKKNLHGVDFQQVLKTLMIAFYFQEVRKKKQEL